MSRVPTPQYLPPRPAPAAPEGVDFADSAKAAIEAARLAERQGRRDDARAQYERALRMLSGPESASAASAIIRWVARTHYVDGNLDAALDSLEAALAVAHACGDEGAAGHALNVQAGVHWQRGDLEAAERLYQEARQSAERAGDTKLGAMSAQNLGVIANVRGEFETARRHYEASLDQYRLLGLARDVALTLNNLGKLDESLRQWDAAERAYDEALQISAILGEVSLRLTIQVNLAELWVARGGFDRAREWCDRALELSRATGDDHALGELHAAYGIVAREGGEHMAAEEHFAKADQVAAAREDLLLSAKIARERAELHRRQGRHREMLQSLNRAHRQFTQLRARVDLADVSHRTRELEADFVERVRRWGESIESKDRYTQGHCVRVADLACALAKRAGMDDGSLFWFRIGALLHDVGKLVVPPEVLNKAGPLTADEWQVMKRHPVAGVEMLADIEFPWDVLPMVQSHHERWDGRGYPQGLAGEAIPRTARILAIADVYDALTSHRSYRTPLSHEEAMGVMRQDAGASFDPALFPLFETVAADPALRRDTPGTGDAASPSAPPRTPTYHLDDLTGLPLRAAFAERAAQALADAKAGGGAVSLLVVDIDHFKRINDTHGHLQGDRVLRTVADVLRNVAGERHSLFRYAGDELVLLLARTDHREALATAERLCKAVRETLVPARDETGSCGVTLSIGVATAPLHGDSLDELFGAADRALYHVKRRGRDGASGPGAHGAVPPEPSLDHFVGRAEETRRLVRLLESSGAGETRLISVIGEGGVGKTTLLRRLAPEVQLRGGALVVGRAVEGDVQRPYAPWAQVIRAIEQLGPLPHRLWRELPELVPTLATTVAPPERQPGSQYALLEEIAAYLELACAQRQIVVVLEDMHWADSATWEALEHVASRLTAARLLICLTIREEDSGSAPARRRARVAAQDRYQELTLWRLTREEIREWVQSAFHRDDAGRELSPFLYEHTEGNAFFVVQLLRTMLDEGAIRHDGMQWTWSPPAELRLPRGVLDLIARRLDRLSEPSRRVLAGAAVIGRVFDVELAVAAGVEGPEAIAAAVDEGIAAAVLEPVRDAEQARYAFRHTLLVDGALGAVNPRRVRRLHEGVARALEVRSPVDAAEVARHYDAAGAGPSAHRWSLRAGQEAARLHALDQASAFFTLALRHAAGEEQETAARLGLAGVHEAAGRYVEAVDLYQQVAAAYEGGDQLDSVLPILRAVERLRVWQGVPPQRTIDACATLLDAALARGLREERVALLTMISQAHSRMSDWEAAERVARECVMLAAGIGAPGVQAQALTRLGTALLETRPDEALALYGRALALFEEAGDRRGEIRCHIDGGLAHARVGRVDAAERALELALQLGHDAHAADLAGLASLNLGVMRMQSRRYDQAQARLEEAHRLFRTMRNAPYQLSALYNLGHLARQRGEPAAALDLYLECVELARAIGQPDIETGALSGAGLVALRLGRREVADASLVEVAARLGSRPDWWFQGRELAEAFRIRAALTAGDVSGARERLGAALALAQRHDASAATWLRQDCADALDVPLRPTPTSLARISSMDGPARAPKSGTRG